uniref:Uncharacterized protein LOC114344290 n=1 Tax=Diabrotica virgifera virgifera TaxID=50390 RepID=A0A6P7GMR6_DIAVI
MRIDKRNKWIKAIRKQSLYGLNWIPKRTDRICSAHFVGNMTSNDLSHPSYVPTIFPKDYKPKIINPDATLNRFNRLNERSAKKVIEMNSSKISIGIWLDKCGFIGGSPDGLCKDDFTINTKCLYKLRESKSLVNDMYYKNYIVYVNEKKYK